MKLTLFVENGCSSCERARGIVAELSHTWSELDLEVVDIAGADELPEAVFAVPAYLLDGQVISLGNPSLDVLHDLLRNAK